MEYFVRREEVIKAIENTSAAFEEKVAALEAEKGALEIELFLLQQDLSKSAAGKYRALAVEEKARADAIEAEIATLRARCAVAEEALDSLGVHAVPEIAPGWTGVPTVEWDAVIQRIDDAAREGEAA